MIVVNDGSSDATVTVAQEYGFRLINIKKGGLSNARNIGLKEAAGEIVAYIDDDAYPDPHWLTYLASSFMKWNHAGIGGPNITPPGDGPVAECVANAPGVPIHVLLSDQEAEHIPGCNMAFRKSALELVGGFDPHFRVAGDDVDLCWRLQEKGWTLGFSPAAVVWHHRRNSLRAYLRQQLNYGRAEGLLERKWPEKYNETGHVHWAGRIYNRGLMKGLTFRRERIYHGVWGSAPFQSLTEPAPILISSLVHMPEWHLVSAGLAALSILGALWKPMLFALPLLVLTTGASLAQAILGARHAAFSNTCRSRLKRLALHGLTALLHLVQPLARLGGRLSNGLTPWRRNGTSGLSLPWPRTTTIWSENWRGVEDRLGSLLAMLRADRTIVRLGGDYDRWDLEVGGGLLGTVRVRMAIEEHGAGRQLVRVRVWPRWTRIGILLTPILATLSVWAAYDQAWPACFGLGTAAGLLALWMLKECGNAMHHVLGALRLAKREA